MLLRASPERNAGSHMELPLVTVLWRLDPEPAARTWLHQLNHQVYPAATSAIVLAASLKSLLLQPWRSVAGTAPADSCSILTAETMRSYDIKPIQSH
jgi:hypothetical protein